MCFSRLKNTDNGAYQIVTLNHKVIEQVLVYILYILDFYWKSVSRRSSGLSWLCITETNVGREKTTSVNISISH